MVMKHGLLIWK